MRFLAGAVIGIGISLALAGPAAAAEPYPSKNVRLIVPYPPGGNVDSAARIVADKLQEKLGKPFIIENKAGAGGLIAGEAFAKSENDGYTLFVGANGPVLFAPDHQQARRLSVEARLRSDHHDLDDAAGARGTSFGTGQDRQGIPRPRPPRARQDDDGLARSRHHQPSAQRARAVLARPAVAHRALPRQRAGDQRPDRRTGAVRVRPGFGRAAIHQERHDPGARGHQPAPRSVAPRRADLRRARLQGFRRADVYGPVRARRHVEARSSTSCTRRWRRY